MNSVKQKVNKIRITGQQHLSQTYSNLIELAKLQRPVSVDWRPDVLTVVTVLHRLQLPDAAYIGQSSLNLCHVQNLRPRV